MHLLLESIPPCPVFLSRIEPWQASTRISLANSLVFSSASQRELKSDPFPRQLPIHLRISIKSIIHPASLFLIQYHFQHLTAVLPRPRPLSHNLNRVHYIAQDRIVHGSQGTRMWAFLRLRRAGAVGTFGPRENAARGEEEDVTVGEFLFKFPG